MDIKKQKNKNLSRLKREFLALFGFVILLLFYNTIFGYALFERGVNISLEIDLFKKENLLLLGIQFIMSVLLWIQCGKKIGFFVFEELYTIVGIGLFGINFWLSLDKALFQSHILSVEKNLLDYFNISEVQYYDYVQKIYTPFFLSLFVLSLVIIGFYYKKTIMDVLKKSKVFFMEKQHVLWGKELFNDISYSVTCFVVYLLALYICSFFENRYATYIFIVIVFYVLCNVLIKTEVKKNNNPKDLLEMKKKISSVLLMRTINGALKMSIVTIAGYLFAVSVFFELVEKEVLNITNWMNGFDAGDIFYTELSLVFLVISFVTLLANKTENVYWADVIQYRLVQPANFSIIDISAYIFANLFLSLIAYIYKPIDTLIIISFILTIVLLCALCLKLLSAFYAREGLKEELEKEYQLALEYRKVVYNSEVGDNNKDISTTKLDDLHLFGTRIPIDESDLKIIHDNYIFNEGLREQRFGLGYKSKALLYAKRFDYDINQYKNRLDGLYSNTLKVLAENKIDESSEQILFMLKYGEFEYAKDCILKAVEICPRAYLSVFGESLLHVEKEEALIKFLLEQLERIKKEDGELLYSKRCDEAKKYIVKWMLTPLDINMVKVYLDKAIESNDVFMIRNIFKEGVLYHAYKEIQKESRGNCTNQEVGVLDGAEFIIRLLNNEEFETAYELMREYVTFIRMVKNAFGVKEVENILNQPNYIEYNTYKENNSIREIMKEFIDEVKLGWKRMVSLKYNFSYVDTGCAYEIKVCNLVSVFECLKEMYIAQAMKKETLEIFLEIILECNALIKGMYNNGEAIVHPEIMENFESSLEHPIKIFMNTYNIGIQ